MLQSTNTNSQTTVADLEDSAMAAALESAVEALRARPVSAPASSHSPAPDAAAVVARLTGALRDHDTRFLDDYLLVLVSHNDAEVKAITDELLRNIEGALAAEDCGGALEMAAGTGAGPTGAGGVVLASWLAVSAAWRAPRAAAAPRALCCMLQHLSQQQVLEVARALHGTLEARELVAVSDAVRSAEARGSGVAGAKTGARQWALAGERGLAALLLRAALAKLTSTDVTWRAAALSVEELCTALTPRWNAFEADTQLTAAAVAARVVAGSAARGAVDAGPAAARLLTALAHPPPPALRHHPDYLKATIALSRLQKLFTVDCPARPN